MTLNPRLGLVPSKVLDRLRDYYSAAVDYYEEGCKSDQERMEDEAALEEAEKALLSSIADYKDGTI